MPKIHLSHSSDTFHTPASHQTRSKYTYYSSWNRAAPLLLHIQFHPYSFHQHYTTQLTNFNKRILLDLLHSYLPNFPLYRDTIHTNRHQSIGSTPRSKHPFKFHTNHSNPVLPHFFKHSTENSSNLGAFPRFISFTHPHTSSTYCYCPFIKFS